MCAIQRLRPKKQLYIGDLSKYILLLNQLTGLGGPGGCDRLYSCSSFFCLQKALVAACFALLWVLNPYLEFMNIVLLKYSLAN